MGRSSRQKGNVAVMEPAAMSRLLASAGALGANAESGADAGSSLREALRSALSAPAVDDEERAARVREAVECLQAPRARLAAVVRELLRADGGDALGAEEWKVLDALVAQASDVLAKVKSGEEQDENGEEGDQDALWQALTRVFLRGTEQLGRGDKSKRWMQWCDRVLHAVFASKVDEAEGAGAAAARAVANALIALHAQLAMDGKPVEFKLATLVWKNLTKLAKSHVNVLFGVASSAPEAGDGGKDKDSEGGVTTPLDADETIRFALAAMENSNSRLQACIRAWIGADDEATLASAVASIGVALKPLRLTCRAVQGHFLALAGLVSSSQLEETILATVNVASSLFEIIVVHPTTTAHRLPQKLAQDVRSMLELILTLPGRMETVSGTGTSTLSESGWTIMQSLLWFPADDFVRAINERRQSDSESPIERIDIGSDVATRWAHWCFLVEFVAADPTVHAFENEAEAAVELITKLFDRYQDCGVVSSAATIDEMESLSIESMLVLLNRISDFERLQLVLLNFVAHPLIDQQQLCWAVWKEFVCYCWDEETALAGLNSLFNLADSPSDGDQFLSEQLVDHICRLVAFMYPKLPLTLKAACLARVTSNIETICGDGPLHAYSSKVASRLALFRQLAAAGMLREYSGTDKQQWIAAHLPMALECCGTIVSIIEKEITAPEATMDNAEFTGTMRVLDTCLLVLKSVYDDIVGHEDAAELAELTRIVLPVVAEILSLLAKTVQRPVRVSGTKRIRSGTLAKSNQNEHAELESSITRVVATSLYLLDKFAARLKRNRGNMCVKAMKDLLALARGGNYVGGVKGVNQQTRAALVVSFVKTALSDAQVAPSDVEVVAQLLTALFQQLGLHAKSTKSPLLGWHVIDALYAILASSNIADALTITSMLPPSNTVNDLREIAMLHKQFDNDSDALADAVVSLMASAEVCQARADCVAKRDHLPEKQPERVATSMSPSGVEEGIGVGTTQVKLAASGSSGGKTKRQKLDHLVARCRQVIENCGATAENVTDQELDNATRVLEHIIAKTLTF